jgi:FMN phosphatase YigB (HAD superfamily)
MTSIQGVSLKQIHIIAIYGLGTETGRFLTELSEMESSAKIVGLLDGFRTSGELYGYPIISIDQAIELGVELIIVVARPGSCKAIAKRIRNICIDNNVALFDVRGNDLLAENKVSFCYSDVQGFKAETRETLNERISEVEVVSFDLFDTLVCRKLFSYTDVFELVEQKLVARGVAAEGLSKARIAMEKELSAQGAPKLEDIYEKVIDCIDIRISARELAEIERETDLAVIAPRRGWDEVFDHIRSMGKKVVITTDSYYSLEWIRNLLEKNGIAGIDRIYVSCEYGKAKNQGLYQALVDDYPGCRILHIGDDEYADIEKAREAGLDTFKIMSGRDYFDTLGGLGLEESVETLSDRVKTGLLVKHLFADPFVFEKNNGKVFVESAYDVGYLFAAPLITGFCLWMKREIEKAGIEQVLLCARDGYLFKRLYDLICDKGQGEKYKYFLTSRTAAIRAGVETSADVEYVDSMKFFGDEKDEVDVRFGVTSDEVMAKGRTQAILERAKSQRDNYLKYIQSAGIEDKKTALFDFVAKGTTQYFISRLMPGAEIGGYYFLQLEPGFMSDKGLDITPFYSEQEKDSSTIYDNYYILETMLTSLDPSVEEFDGAGSPVFAKETRSEGDLACVERMQRGIEDFFREYIALLPGYGDVKWENKALDEALLGLVGKIDVLDEQFLDLNVEDPFFGRMTRVGDLLE